MIIWDRLKIFRAKTGKGSEMGARLLEVPEFRDVVEWNKTLKLELILELYIISYQFVLGYCTSVSTDFVD